MLTLKRNWDNGKIRAFKALGFTVGFYLSSCTNTLSDLECGGTKPAECHMCQSVKIPKYILLNSKESTRELLSTIHKYNTEPTSQLAKNLSKGGLSGDQVASITNTHLKENTERIKCVIEGVVKIIDKELDIVYKTVEGTYQIEEKNLDNVDKKDERDHSERTTALANTHALAMKDKDNENLEAITTINNEYKTKALTIVTEKDKHKSELDYDMEVEKKKLDVLINKDNSDSAVRKEKISLQKLEVTENVKKEIEITKEQEESKRKRLEQEGLTAREVNKNEKEANTAMYKEGEVTRREKHKEDKTTERTQIMEDASVIKEVVKGGTEIVKAGINSVLGSAARAADAYNKLNLTPSEKRKKEIEEEN